MTFSALITTLVTLLLPPSLGEPLIAGLIDIFGVDQQSGEFIMETYYPQVNLFFITNYKKRLQCFLIIHQGVKSEVSFDHLLVRQQELAVEALELAI